jgi:Rod binding domain-containing protein
MSDAIAKLQSTALLPFAVNEGGIGAGNGERRDPEKVAQDFESIFIVFMMKEMGKTAQVRKKGYMEETYMAMVNQQVGECLARKGIGIKEMILKYLSGQDVKF